VVGDIDGDTKVDLAVGNFITGQAFIFAGGTPWATEADAKYRIVDSGNNALGASIARLGDFDGDGSPDFAIGESTFNGRAGRVTIIRGVPAGVPFGALTTLPDAFGTLLNGKPRAMHIDGATPNGRLGFSVVGLGSFYSGGGSTLAALAPTAGAGQVFTFAGGSGDPTGTIALASAAHSFTIPAGGGRSSVKNLGALTTTKQGLGFGAPNWTAADGVAYVALGDSSSGPFQTVSAFTNSATSGIVNGAFGSAVFGGGFSGLDTSVSLIGSADPDVGICDWTESGGTSRLYLYTGARAIAGSGDVTSPVTGADVIWPVQVTSGGPAWIGCSFGSGPIKDMNGDGYADIALGEFNSTLATYDGRAIILY
jgi:hypothetical protein